MICNVCGTAAYPEPLLCPRCAARDWREAGTVAGVVEELTDRDGPVAAVRTELGPRLIARVGEDVRAGDAVVVELVDGRTFARAAP